MPVTALTPDTQQAFGYLQYFFPTDLPPYTFTAGVCADINQDLALVYYPPNDANVWSYVWTVYAYIPDFLSRTSLFKSALPKYDLGLYSVLFRGAVVQSGFINYVSQRLSLYSCWSADAGQSYPSPYIPPVPISNAYLYYLVGTLSGSINYGTDITVNLTNGIPNTASIVVYYQATWVAGTSSPTSFGDI